MPVQNSSTENLENFLPGMFRYGVLGFLYITCLLYFYNNSTQFILFIVVFILNFFTIVFLYKDFLSLPILTESLFGENANNFTKFFVFSIFVTLILNISTFSIILSVFDYGKRTTNDYLTYTMTPNNVQLLTDFKKAYYWYMIFTSFFVFVVIFSHASENLKIVLQNMIGFILSFAIITISSYQCYLSVEFLKNRKYKLQLYQ